MCRTPASLRLSGKVLPDWWNSGWLNARYLARHLGAKIGPAKDWNWMATELALGREDTVRLADGVELDCTATSIW